MRRASGHFAHHRRATSMQRQVFAALVFAIAAAGATVGIVMWTFGGGSEWHGELSRAHAFVGHQLGAVWDDPPARRVLLRSASADLGIGLAASDADGRPLEAFGRTDCSRPLALRVPAHGPLQGRVRVCVDRFNARGPRWVTPLALAMSALVLWGVAGLWARRLARPLRELTRVARELGAGKLESRARLRHGARGEVGELGNALNEMAARIERQMADQRQLLAAVSHEMRSPLARLRLLVEIAREDRARDVLTEIEAELVEMDALVEDLLAGARLDFRAVTERELDPREIAARAAERLGAGAPPVEVLGEAGKLRADPTLLGRAIGALLDNARKHGGGAQVLRVRGTPGEVRFEVDDAGPGISAADLPHVFEPFYQGGSEAKARGVGLGLALVQRIAQAHGGRATAENLPGAGARVTIALPRR
jgi:signal transduction histidine kinase